MYIPPFWKWQRGKTAGHHTPALGGEAASGPGGSWVTCAQWDRTSELSTPCFFVTAARSCCNDKLLFTRNDQAAGAIAKHTAFWGASALTYVDTCST